MLRRCDWCTQDPDYIAYHDQEWGVPLKDSHALFELLMLESMQAGLSWITILKRRENYRQAFDNFNANKIVRYDEKKIASLLQNPGIIRNRAKVKAIINNANCYLEIQNNQDFSDFIWAFTDFKVIKNKWRHHADIPAYTPLSEIMAITLKKQGFTFLGKTICYAFMQAAGMVNDHLVTCYRYPLVALPCN